MTHRVTITGATGNNGRAIVEDLLAHGVHVRAVGRQAAKLAPLAAKGAEPSVGDMSNVAFLTNAFRGADAVFAMIPQRFDVPDYAADQRRLVNATIEALEEAQVPRVVALSTPAAQLRLGPPVALAEFEERVRAIRGVSSVVLHPMYYMENFLASIPMIKTAAITGGAIRGDVALPMVATRDVAAVAAEYLIAPTLEGHQVRPLLGPRDYTFREASTVIGAAVDLPELPYVEFPEEGFREALRQNGFSDSAVNAFVELTQAYNDGRIQRTVHRDDATTTSTTIEDFAHQVFAPVYRTSDQTT